MGFLKRIPKDYLVGIFLNGLREDIKAEVKLYDPPDSYGVDDEGPDG